MALPVLSPALCHHTPGSGRGRAQTAPLPSTLLQNSSNSWDFWDPETKQTHPTHRHGSAGWRGAMSPAAPTSLPADPVALGGLGADPAYGCRSWSLPCPSR